MPAERDLHVRDAPGPRVGDCLVSQGCECVIGILLAFVAGCRLVAHGGR